MGDSPWFLLFLVLATALLIVAASGKISRPRAARIPFWKVLRKKNTRFRFDMGHPDMVETPAGRPLRRSYSWDDALGGGTRRDTVKPHGSLCP